MRPIFAQGDLVLFQGDSITDSGRDRLNPDNLGYGYAFLAASLFSAQYPELGVTFLNRGVSGNRACDMRKRWQEDCVALQPDWVSILIGINDTWRRFDSGLVTTATEFEEHCRAMLDDVRTRTNANLILCEPFLLPTPEDRIAWREDLDPKIHVVRALAREYGAIYIPFDGIFAQYSARQELTYWAADGVHPTAAGAALMAKAWLDAVMTD
jgi:lysophospholipase L1-like esterase